MVCGTWQHMVKVERSIVELSSTQLIHCPVETGKADTMDLSGARPQGPDTCEGNPGGKKAERKKRKAGERIEPGRAGSCEEVQFVLVKLAAIWPASELVLEVIFIAAFTAWQARAAPMREWLPTCQCSAIQLMERNKHE